MKPTASVTNIHSDKTALIRIIKDNADGSDAARSVGWMAVKQDQVDEAKETFRTKNPEASFNFDIYTIGQLAEMPTSFYSEMPAWLYFRIMIEVAELSMSNPATYPYPTD